MSGIIADESASAITLKRAEGATDVIAQRSDRDDRVHGRVADARRSRERSYRLRTLLT